SWPHPAAAHARGQGQYSYLVPRRRREPTPDGSRRVFGPLGVRVVAGSSPAMTQLRRRRTPLEAPAPPRKARTHPSPARGEPAPHKTQRPGPLSWGSWPLMARRRRGAPGRLVVAEGADLADIDALALQHVAIGEDGAEVV